VLANFSKVGIVVKSAAVSDFRPEKVAKDKIKKNGSELTLRLEGTPDILKELGRRKKNQILVGFSAETVNLVENGQKKLKEKNLDLVVANDVGVPGAGFNWDTNIIKIIDREGKVEELPLMDKEKAAEKIWDRIVGLMRLRKKR
jgi:phosphopantothenoylcysteine decarboxylase/phosphopantothenate--cysteine ligase